MTRRDTTHWQADALRTILCYPVPSFLTGSCRAVDLLIWVSRGRWIWWRCNMRNKYAFVFLKINEIWELLYWAQLCEIYPRYKPTLHHDSFDLFQENIRYYEDVCDFYSKMGKMRHFIYFLSFEIFWKAEIIIFRKSTKPNNYMATTQTADHFTSKYYFFEVSSLTMKLIGKFWPASQTMRNGNSPTSYRAESIQWCRIWLSVA